MKISEKALLDRLNGQKLTDWQLKSAYWMEIGKRKVKIEAAHEEGVFYAQQSLKMMAALDSLQGTTGEEWKRLSIKSQFFERKLKEDRIKLAQ